MAGHQKIQACDVAMGDVTSYGLVVATEVEGDMVRIVAEHQGKRSGTTLPATTLVTVW